MIYNSKYHVVIMHGGSSNGTVMADTWVYNVGTKTWTQLHPSFSPRRQLHGMAYDRTNDIIIMYGGADQYDNNRKETFVFRYQPSGDTTPPDPPKKLRIVE